MSIVLPPLSALGTVWYVELFDSLNQEKADETSGLVRLFLTDFEEKYSRFKPHSLISTLNNTGALINPDQTTIALLTLAQKFYRDTGGIFNPLIGEHLLARGYDTNYSFTPKTEPSDFPSPLTALSISRESIKLTAGQIDLGGYGKGWLIDQLSLFLRDRGFQYFLINGGGDMYATSNYDEPIPIYLEHPTLPNTYIAETTLKNQGFAASSTEKRRWQVAGKKYSHIVDTTNPTKNSSDLNNDTFGIYVKAPLAVTADAWSTTLLISKPETHQALLTQEQVTHATFNVQSGTLISSPNF